MAGDRLKELDVGALRDELRHCLMPQIVPAKGTDPTPLAALLVRHPFAEPRLPLGLLELAADEIARVDRTADDAAEDQIFVA
jgi:hypothetical protein